MTIDSQAILILCSNLCVGEGLTPFKPSEWKDLAQRLLAHKLRPGSLLSATKDEIVANLNCEEEYADRIVRLVGRSASLFFEISKYENIGISLVTRADSTYPRRLRSRLGDSCPPFFFYAGDLSLLNKKSLGIVGSRNMNGADANFESALVEDAVLNKYVIVSGGARGADSIAEDVALDSGGRAVEFIADSMINKLCTSKAIKAVQQGKLLVLSVVNPDAHFNVGNAMNRNKYIYAQSDAVVAIKSMKHGGTWSGVMENLKKQYCPVFCWNNSEYADNLALIQSGAIPIDSDWNVKSVALDNKRSLLKDSKSTEPKKNSQLSLIS